MNRIGGRRMMQRVTSAFVVLSISRIVGLVRELTITLAFGMSYLTDLFYQVTWPLAAFTTIANGPFTTAFSARMANAQVEARAVHARYYLRIALWVACFLSALCLASALFALAFGYGELFLVLAPLSAAAFCVTISGFCYALAISAGWVTLAALLLFSGNLAFVLCVVTVWVLGVSLAAWTLPILYSVGVTACLPYCWIIWSRYVAENSSTDTLVYPIVGFGKTFLLAGIETAFFLVTQALVILLATLTDDGWVTAVALVQRIVMSVNGLLIGPYASILMLRVTQENENSLSLFRSGFLRAAFFLTTAAFLLGGLVPCIGGSLILSAVSEMDDSVGIVLRILPVFGLWLLPVGLNILVCRTMFGIGLERIFTVGTVCGYVVANILRLVAFAIGGFEWAIGVGAFVELVVVLWLASLTVSRLRSREAG